jgi:hypothetical protein
LTSYSTYQIFFLAFAKLGPTWSGAEGQCFLETLWTVVVASLMVVGMYGILGIEEESLN